METPTCVACSKPAEYLPRIRFRNTRDIGLVIHLPFCHGCSLKIPDRLEDGSVPTFLGLFDFNIKAYRKMFRDCGLELLHPTDIEVAWLGLETPEAQNSLAMMGVLDAEYAPVFIKVKSDREKGVVRLCCSIFPDSVIEMTPEKSRDIAIDLSSMIESRQFSSVSIKFSVRPGVELPVLCLSVESARRLSHDLVSAAKDLLS